MLSSLIVCNNMVNESISPFNSAHAVCMDHHRSYQDDDLNEIIVIFIIIIIIVIVIIIIIIQNEQ